MTEIKKEDPNYWRNALARFAVNQARELGIDVPKTDWVLEITEKDAQETLEALEETQILIENSFPLD